MQTPLNHDLDLELTRLMRATPAQVWRCWSDPTLFCRWWTPKPVITKDVVLELTPGGLFYTVMVMPDGTEHPGGGCFLAVDPERRIVFTDMMERGFRPSSHEMFGFTGVFTFAPEDGGTRYTARTMHRTPDVAKQHSDMGFHDGWGTVAGQLEALAATL